MKPKMWSMFVGEKRERMGGVGGGMMMEKGKGIVTRHTAVEDVKREDESNEKMFDKIFVHSMTTVLWSIEHNICQRSTNCSRIHILVIIIIISCCRLHLRLTLCLTSRVVSMFSRVHFLICWARRRLGVHNPRNSFAKHSKTL